MRHLTLAAATISALAFAGTAAYADANYGPNKKGEQCWHTQVNDSIGYWSPCNPGQNGRAQATRTSAPARANNTATQRR